MAGQRVQLERLWPGLDALWNQGSLTGFAKAIGFAILLILTILTSIVWPEWFSPWRSTMVCLCSLGYWLVVAGGDLAIESARRTGAAKFQVAARRVDEWFRAAQAEYVRGHWPESQRLALRIVDHDPLDVEAHLLLATLARRRGDHEAARETLDRIMTLPRGEVWAAEVADERMWVESESKVAVEGTQLRVVGRIEAA